MPESFFPKFVRQRQTGEVGINAVSSIVNDKFKWIFRRVNAEHDFGVDGYIDVVTDDGNVTGQSVAVQIKAGASFFRTKTAIGFVFYGETKHLNYYLNLRVPIWPAAGSADTELGVLMEPEVCHGETEVYTRVQA
jgi:hypothetical protein